MPTESLFRLGVIELDWPRPGAALARVNTKAPLLAGLLLFIYLFLLVIATSTSIRMIHSIRHESQSQIYLDELGLWLVVQRSRLFYQ